jgi:DNA-binding ferritin-like protein
MSYAPLHSPFRIPLDHPDHPYQQMRRQQDAERGTPGFPLVSSGNPGDPERIEYHHQRAAGEAIEEDLDEKPAADAECLCQHLTLLAAFSAQLQLQAHLLHFSYRGSNFISIHGLLKEGYERHLQEFDSLLEAVQMMGHDTPATHKELLKILPAFEHAMSTDNCQLSNYRENLLQQRKLAQEVEKEAQEAREIGIANMLAEIDAAAAKAAWFIAATLKAQP